MRHVWLVVSWWEVLLVVHLRRLSVHDLVNIFGRQVMKLERLQASESVALRRLHWLRLLGLAANGRILLLLCRALLPVEDLCTPDSEVRGILQVQI